MPSSEAHSILIRAASSDLDAAVGSDLDTRYEQIAYCTDRIARPILS
jgi:hypothetical protein